LETRVERRGIEEWGFQGEKDVHLEHEGASYLEGSFMEGKGMRLGVGVH
jgi:hypothetical protein